MKKTNIKETLQNPNHTSTGSVHRNESHLSTGGGCRKVIWGVFEFLLTFATSLSKQQEKFGITCFEMKKYNWENQLKYLFGKLLNN